MITNRDRADWASDALEEFAADTRHYSVNLDVDAVETDEDRVEAAEILRDLLGDLRHWAERVGVDYDLAAQMGKEMYETEKEEDEPGDDEDDD